MLRRVIGLVLLALAQAAWADFSFVHITDTHFTSAEDEKSKAALLAPLCREIAELRPGPAFAIGTGDFVELGRAEEYAVAAKVLPLMKLKLHAAPGNHDVRWNPLGKEGFIRGMQQPLFQSFEHEGVHFFLLDSTVLLEHWSHIGQDQLDWLAGQLKVIGPDKPIIMAFHHWVGRDKMQVDNEQALIDLLEPYNVRLYLQGHGHADLLWNINGVPAVMARGLYQGSYHVVEIGKETLKVRRRSLGKAKADAEQADKAAPADGEVTWTDIVEVPLKKPAAPKWAAALDQKTVRWKVNAAGDLPPAAALSYRVDSGAAVTMARGDAGWLAEADAADLPAGEHVLSVRAELPDGRVYLKSLTLSHQRADAPVPLWRMNVGGAVQSRLVRNGKYLYLTTMTGDVVALDTATGKQWRTRLRGAVFSTPVVGDGLLYVGCEDHHVYAVDAASGVVKWRTRTGGGVFASGAIAKGVLCIASVDRKVYGLDPTTGNVLWTSELQGMAQSQAATDGTHFFLGTWDNTIRCLDAAGKGIWSRQVGRDAKTDRIQFYYSPAIGSPAVGDGLAYFISNDGMLHALKTANGQSAWSFDGKSLGYSSPLLHGGKLYAAIGTEGKVFAFDARDGRSLWEGKVPGTVYDSSFAIARGKLFIGTARGQLCALDAASGKLLWTYSLGPAHLLASPAVDEQRVYIANMAGDVFAFEVGK